MRLVCPICHAAYNIDERRLPAGGANVRCPKCRGVFPVVPGRDASAEPRNAPAPATRPAPAAGQREAHPAVTAPPAPAVGPPPLPPVVAPPPPPVTTPPALETPPPPPAPAVTAPPALVTPPPPAVVTPPPPLAAAPPPDDDVRASAEPADPFVAPPSPFAETWPPEGVEPPQAVVDSVPPAAPPAPHAAAASSATAAEPAQPAFDPLPSFFEPTNTALPPVNVAAPPARPPPPPARPSDLGFGEVDLGEDAPFATDEKPRPEAVAPPPPSSPPEHAVLGAEEPFPFETPDDAAPVRAPEPPRADHGAFQEHVALEQQAATPEPALEHPFGEEPPVETIGITGAEPALPPPPAVRAASAPVAPPPALERRPPAAMPAGAPPPADEQLEDLFDAPPPTEATDVAKTRAAVPTAAATTVAVPAPPVVRKEEGAAAESPAAPRPRRRRLLIAAAGAVLLLLALGAAATFTPYGTVVYRLVTGRSGSHGPGARFVAEARQRLAEDRFTSVKAAVELADRALRLDRKDEEARATYTHAVALLARRHGAAAAAWTHARGFLGELGKRVSKDPEAAKAVLSAALVTGDRASADAAIAALEKHVGSAGAGDGDALLVLGDAALVRDDLSRAATYYGRIEALQPGSVRANHGLGVVAARRGDLASARRLLEGALSRDPQHVTTAVELASLALTAGDRERAESLARDVLADAQSQAGPRQRARARTVIGQLLARSIDEHVEASLGAAERELEAAVKEDPDDVEPRLAHAEFLLDRGAADRGVEALAPIPAGLRDGRVVAVHARLLEAQGKPQEAAALVEAALGKSPGDARLLFAKGLLANDIGKQADADRLWSDAVQRDPAAFEPHLALAQARFLRGDLEGAEKELKLASDRAPAHPRVASMGADLLLARHDLAGAEAGYDRALALDRSHGPAYLGLARVALEFGDATSTRNYLKKAVTVTPGLTPAQALYGEVLWKAGDLPGSRKAFERAVALDPRDATSLARLGAIELLQGDRDAAVNHLKSAVSLTVPSAEVRAWYGRALLAKNEPQAAIEQLRKSIELDARDPLVHLQLGQAYERVSNLNDAAQEYRAAQERAPQMLEPYEALGMLYATQNRCQEALPQLERAVVLAHQENRIRIALADCKTKLGRHVEAVALYRRVLQSDPKQVGLYYKIARAQHEATGARDALPWYERAAHEEPANPMPHYYIAFAHKERGRAAKAVAEFREYLRINPGALDRKDIEREIEDLSSGEPERP